MTTPPATPATLPAPESGARRLPVVGVMGSGVRAHTELAAPLGRGLARMGVHLLTGGGGGVMEAASRAFAEVDGRAGLVVGVLPGSTRCASAEPSQGMPPAGYPNTWVELAVRTHLAARGAAGDSVASRNHVNVLSSDMVVALPGGEGTASECALARRYGRPLVLLGDTGRARELATMPAPAPQPASPYAAGTASPGVWATKNPAEALSLVAQLLGCHPGPS